MKQIQSQVNSIFLIFKISYLFSQIDSSESFFRLSRMYLLTILLLLKFIYSWWKRKTLLNNTIERPVILFLSKSVLFFFKFDVSFFFIYTRNALKKSYDVLFYYNHRKSLIGLETSVRKEWAFEFYNHFFIQFSIRMKKRNFERLLISICDISMNSSVSPLMIK
jgi:hypothetical protein